MQLLCIYSTANAVVLTFCYMWDMVCNFFSKKQTGEQLGENNAILIWGLSRNATNKNIHN